MVFCSCRVWRPLRRIRTHVQKKVGTEFFDFVATMASRVALWLLLAVVAVSFVVPTTTQNVQKLDLPNVILQIGDPRSVTTLQFITVCAAVAVKVMHIPQATVDCFFVSVKMQLKDGDLMKQRRRHEYSVIKTHGYLSDTQKKFFHESLPGSKSEDGRDGAWLFHTTYFNKTPKKKVVEILTENIPQKVTTDTSDVVANGVYAKRKAYEDAFSLSPHQSTILYEYLESWDLLRMCCGEQMSTWWRNHLVGQVGNKRAHFDGRDNPAKACLEVDIDQAERNLMTSELYRAMSDRCDMLGHLSNIDGPLTGRYCRTCNENIRNFGLGFNTNCSQSKEYYCSHSSYNHTTC